MDDIDFGDMSMMELFRMEAETQTSVLSEGLLELESDPSNVQRVEELMRAAHSLKGAARIVNLEPAVKIAHKMEDRFVEVQEGKRVFGSDDVDRLLEALDLLKAIGNWTDAEIESRTAETRETVSRILLALDSLGSGGSVPAPSATPVESTPSVFEQEPPPVWIDDSEVSTDVEPQEPAKAPTEVAAAASSKVTERKPTARSESSKDAAVRVSAGSLSRLMELAAETLVESRRLAPTSSELNEIQSLHYGIESVLTSLKNHLHLLGADESTALTIHQLQHRTERARERVSDYLRHFDEHLRRNSRLAEMLYHETLSSRMRPFGEGIGGYPRMVRDLSKSLGKKVKFTTLGKETEVDRDVLEKLDAPLNHILRNALDHGLEGPEERRNKGKEETGSVTLEARHHAGMLVIEIADDGRGIDIERLRRKVVEKGLSAEEVANGLSEDELLEFLFLPAFSTTDKVTEISGRGVGLDVVQSLMQELGGSVRIENHWPQGAMFHLQLPITRSVVRALVVDIAGERYAIPISRVDHISRMAAEEIRMVEGRHYATINGKEVGLISAREVLEIQDESETNDEVCCIVVLSDRMLQYGLEVDGFIGEEEFVVRPLDPRLGKVLDVNAVAIQEDGTPILVLDIDDLVRSMNSFLQDDHWRTHARKSSADSKSTEGSKRVLVVDDSITVRQLQKQLLESHGYEVQLAMDGMEGWNAARLGHYDLIVSDVDMPRMTGIDFVKRLRDDTRLNTIPVIIVSYKDRAEDRIKGMEAGANLYLTKSSFQDETYMNAIVDLIGEAKT